jgi:hypothetical protein
MDGMGSGSHLVGIEMYNYGHKSEQVYDTRKHTRNAFLVPVVVEVFYTCFNGRGQKVAATTVEVTLDLSQIPTT